MTRRLTTLLVLVFLMLLGKTHATSIYFPKFGTPVVTKDKLIFSGAGGKSKRLICIERSTRKKFWDVTDDSKILTPEFMLKEKLIVTANSDFYSCDLESGLLKLLYQTGYKYCHASKLQKDVIFVQGQKDKAGYLSCVNPSDWKKVWETKNIIHSIAEGKEALLCQEAVQIPSGEDGYSIKETKLVALSQRDGKVLWEYGLPNQSWVYGGIAVNNYFVVNIESTIHCFNQADGVDVKRLKIGDDSYTSTSFALRDNRLLLWTRLGDDVFSGHVLFDLTVPDLQTNKLFKPDWYSATTFLHGDIVMGQTIGRLDVFNLETGKKLWKGGQWNWDGVHDGWIYFSTMDEGGKSTSINRIEVKTGKREKLYEEALPEEMQWKNTR